MIRKTTGDLEHDPALMAFLAGMGVLDTRDTVGMTGFSLHPLFTGFVLAFGFAQCSSPLTAILE